MQSLLDVDVGGTCT